MQRRREKRYEVWESVVLSVLEASNPRHCAATVVDISRYGYRVLSAMEVAVGAEVLITLNSVAIRGRVRHCESSSTDTFTAGIEITKVNGGVAAANNPAHKSSAINGSSDPAAANVL